MPSISSDAQVVDHVDPKLWHEPWGPSVARQQLALVYKELGDWLGGEHVQPFEVFFDLLPVSTSAQSILEIGCGVGHYGQLLLLSQKPYTYIGVDVSPAMITWARRGFPAVQTIREDGEQLDGISDNKYDIVVLGSVLNHTPDWEKMLATAQRIAKKWLLLHRMPMYIGGDEKCRLTVKNGYGAQMAERQFNELAIISWLGLKIVEQKSWSHVGKQFQASYLVKV